MTIAPLTSVPLSTPPESTPDIPPSQSGVFARLNVFLDKHVLPYPVKYLTNRITILGTLCLLIPLIIFADVTVFVLAANSYLNVMSVVVSSTVLLYSTLSDARDKAANQRREEIATLHQQQVDALMQADHLRIQYIHDHLDEIQQMLSGQLVEIQNENQTKYAARHNEVLDQISVHSKDLEALRGLLHALPTAPSSPIAVAPIVLTTPTTPDAPHG